MATNSQVLARKYRPQVFKDLIGQDALVQTITNAIKQNRLAQAYMLTGIRGIGKTTSARIIAKGLNCIGEDGKGGMTPNPCGKCKHCQDIANDAHIDVIEIDAASNTGVDNVREIIEGAKYNPVSARYKIYIIDEVHMLSKPAFNALLKTLEEPPERVKFIFATTEVRKVPLTILSRCQRFDLKRIEANQLTDYLEKICKNEKVKFSREVLYLIAKAGDGSVRDSLSLLDQAMTQLPNNPSVEDVRKMLGVADKGALLDLYTSVINGKMDDVFNLLQTQYQSGADALTLVQDMLDLTYKITTLKVVPKQTGLDGFTENEQKTLKDLAQSTSMYVLTAYWQILMKGIQEVRSADMPFQAVQMLMIRLAYLSDIPGPEQLLSDVKKNVETNVMTQPKAATIKQQPIAEKKPAADSKPLFQNMQDIVNLARKKGERILAFNIENFVRPIELTTNALNCSFAPGVPHSFAAQLGKFLNEATGTTWQLDIQKSGGNPSLKEQKEAQKQQTLNTLKQKPIITDIEKAFPGVKIQKVHSLSEDLDAESNNNTDEN
ncbi:MAG: DNA polymerase III subunit gamma/tau [Alphaproteobacteria bacterium]|nr:DNA polymerase III subunit gamma/tau [Alphaproteobacteria bacterium]